MSNNKLRFTFKREANDKKLTVNLKGAVVDLIDDYLRVHKHLTGEDVAVDVFLAGAISDVLPRDKNFVETLKELNGKSSSKTSVN